LPLFSTLIGPDLRGPNDPKKGKQGCRHLAGPENVATPDPLSSRVAPPLKAGAPAFLLPSEAPPEARQPPLRDLRHMSLVFALSYDIDIDILEVTGRTAPPEEAVGRLLRRYSSGVPRIDFDALGKGLRSQWRESAEARVIIVNTSFPMYERIGETEDYLFETVVLHLLGEEEDPLLYADARQKL
jgi:hypothetical protein